MTEKINTPLADILLKLCPNDGIQRRIARLRDLTDIPSTTLRSYALYGVQPPILNAYAIFGALKELAWANDKKLYDTLTLQTVFPMVQEPKEEKEVEDGTI